MARASEKVRSFKYQRRSSDDVRERANAKGGNFDTIIKSKYATYKVREGKNLVRVLPPTWEGAKHYGYDIYVNYGIGVDNQSYLSLSKMLREKDPLEEGRRQADRDGDKDLAKALTPRQRILMWVIDRNDEDAGPQLWPAPFTVDKDLANIAFDEDTKEVVFIDDPNEGCDVRFHKEGQGLKTKYDASKMRLMKPSPLHDDASIQQEWLDFIQANPIPDCLQFYDYDHIANVFDGHARVETDDDDDKPKRSAKPSKRDEDEEDEPQARDFPRGRGAEAPERPVQRSRVVDEDGPAPARRRTAPVEEPEDETEEVEVKKPSIRDRLQTRRSRIVDEDEDAPF